MSQAGESVKPPLTLMKALCAAFGELRNPTNDREGQDGNRRYRYCDLSQISEMLRPILPKHGLYPITTTRLENGVEIGRTAIVHECGEEVFCEWSIPGDLTIKEYGAWLTYKTRYSIRSLLFVYGAADDNDGKELEDREREKALAKEALAKQRKPIKATSAYDGRTLKPGEDPRPPEPPEKPKDTALVDGKLLLALRESGITLEAFRQWYIKAGWYPEDVQPQDLPADFVEEVLENWQKILPQLKGATK